jgi:predicted nuclease of predicted toxin-antitoxin system
MKFLADMGISPRGVAALRQQGHDALHLQEQDLGHIHDPEILAKARAEGRILLTHDLDFGELLATSGSPSQISEFFKNSEILWNLSSILEHQADALVKGAVVSVMELKARIRLLPI